MGAGTVRSGISDKNPAIFWCFCPAFQGVQQHSPSIESRHHKTSARLFTLKVSLLAEFGVFTLGKERLIVSFIKNAS